MPSHFKNQLLYLSILLGLLNFSCGRNERLRIYSVDKSQCITIITKSDIRYIINGDVKSIPPADYIKLDISNIDPIGDEIGVCWRNSNYEWELVNHQSVVLENKLDTTKYKFNLSWETDKRGIPNCLKYHTRENCGTFGFLRKQVYKNRGLILKE